MVIGGCFLIGVMALVTYGFTKPADRPPVRAPEDTALIVILAILGLVSLAGGTVLLVAGVRGLLRILLGKGSKA
jgi:hypothetical protein